MRQTLHIFRKDARHLWPSIAIVLGLTAVLACLDPRTVAVWYGAWPLNRTVGTIHLLLPLTWWFTIAALVHDEAPADDRQFWLTRPYSRISLVFAKALFVVVFLIAPSCSV